VVFAPHRNWFLQSLTPAQLRLLEPLEPVTLHAGQVVWRPNDLITHFILLDRGIVAVNLPLDGEKGVSVWVVGCVFMLGGRRIFQGARSVTNFIARTHCVGWRIPRERMTKAIARSLELRRRVEDLVDLMDSGLARAAQCMRHTPEQRLCRFLLMMHDVVDGDRIELSQAVVADMLGIDRATVGWHVARLEGIVAADRHGMTILDRRAVERRACDCYQLLIDQRDRIFS
jgi:CRP-like cAMP-binding protein